MTGRDSALDALDVEVGAIIRRAKRRIRAMAAAVHPDLGAGNFLALGFIHDFGPLRAMDLVEKFGVDKAAVSRQIQHMVDLGLVRRDADPDDRRAHLLAATPEGSARLSQVRRDRRRELDRSLADWDEDRLAGLVAALQDYNASVEMTELTQA